MHTLSRAGLSANYHYCSCRWRRWRWLMTDDDCVLLICSSTYGIISINGTTNSFRCVCARISHRNRIPLRECLVGIMFIIHTEVWSDSTWPARIYFHQKWEIDRFRDKCFFRCDQCFWDVRCDGIDDWPECAEEKARKEANKKNSFTCFFVF